MPPKLVRIAVVQNAAQKNVTGSKNWAAVRKEGAFAIVEATTAPANNADEWKIVQWSGDGEPVQGFPHRRKVSLSASKKLHVEAKLGGVTDSADIWVLWAEVKIATSGPRPANAAPFDKGTRDGTQNLGPVTYKSLTASVIDEEAGIFVDNMGASGKMCAVVTLSPKGVNQIVKTGWMIERQVWSHNWLDASPAPNSNQNWTKDTSKPVYLRLTPDTEDKIYDTDAPDLRWGQFTSESYNRFRQWVTWNDEKCSGDAYWHWQARWRVDKDQAKQITLNDLGASDMTLPSKPFFKAGKQ